MLNENDIINFGNKIIESSDNFNTAVTRISEYISYINKFYMVGLSLH